MRTLLLVALVALSAGCLMHGRPSSPHAVAGQVSEDAVGSFDYPPAEIRYRNAVLDELETDRYLVRHVRFPSVGDNGQPDNLVAGHYYESKLPGRRPLVIVLPIWGGHSYPSDRMAKRIRRASGGAAHVFLMRGENYLFDWDELATAENPEIFMDLWKAGANRERTLVIDIRRILDWASPRDDVDISRVGLMGFSHSAVLAATVAANEPRIAATVVVMGGADAHEILTRCPLRRSEGMRLRATEGFGWTLDELARRLEPIIRPFDPATYPGLVDPETVLVVEATKDDCMPAEGRRALYEALGRPARISISASHQRAFLAMTPLTFNRLRTRIWNFLDEQLEISDGAR